MATTRFKKKATGLIAVFFAVFAVAGLCMSPLNVLAAEADTLDEEAYHSIVAVIKKLNKNSAAFNIF